MNSVSYQCHKKRRGKNDFETQGFFCFPFLFFPVFFLTDF